MFEARIRFYGGNLETIRGFAETLGQTWDIYYARGRADVAACPDLTGTFDLLLMFPTAAAKAAFLWDSSWRPAYERTVFFA